MLVQTLYLEEYDWTVTVYYAVDRYYTDEILIKLDDLNVNGVDYQKTKKSLESNELNTGFTYTNFRYKESIVVIGLTTSAAEFQDTFDHEKGHLITHIGTYYHFDPYGENWQYLTGAIGKALFPYAHLFLCDKCRQDFTLHN